MAFFRRKNTEPVVLPELEKYYDAERRERSGLAWLLAFVSIAAVALILIGMFFGGRWLYRTLTTDDKPKTAVVQNDPKTPGTTTPKSDSNVDTSPKPDTTPPPATTPPVTPPASSPAAPSSSTTTLSNTGPTSVVSYFILTTLIGTLLYRMKLRNSVR